MFLEIGDVRGGFAEMRGNNPTTGAFHFYLCRYH